MAFRARKAFGTFEKRAPGLIIELFFSVSKGKEQRLERTRMLLPKGVIT